MMFIVGLLCDSHFCLFLFVCIWSVTFNYFFFFRYVDISFRSRFPITHKHRSHCLSPDVEEEDNEDIPVLMDVTLKHLTAKVFILYNKTDKNKTKTKPKQKQNKNKEQIPFSLNILFTLFQVPVSSPDLTYIQSASVRPVVAFMNTNYTEIPLNLKMNLKLGAFDGAWYLEDAKVNEHMSEAFGRGIEMKVQVCDPYCYCYFYYCC